MSSRSTPSPIRSPGRRTDSGIDVLNGDSFQSIVVWQRDGLGRRRSVADFRQRDPDRSARTRSSGPRSTRSRLTTATDNVRRRAGRGRVATYSSRRLASAIRRGSAQPASSIMLKTAARFLLLRACRGGSCDRDRRRAAAVILDPDRSKTRVNPRWASRRRRRASSLPEPTIRPLIPAPADLVQVAP